VRPYFTDERRQGIGYGRPAELVRLRRAATLEEAFIGYLKEADTSDATLPVTVAKAPPPPARRHADPFSA